jgi:dUTP pyrophosphatase
VIVIAKNLADQTLAFSAGEKVAQLLIQKVEHPLVEEVSELPESERGESAFGSTGL